ncbi:MAG TPA: hypothetical protein VJM12_06480 [Pyrinomonadaceae bacterium]|nr:hypothetical protein [Pyrinomonadaceae bacterium]
MKKFKFLASVAQLSGNAAARFCSALLLTILFAVLLVAPSRAAGEVHALFDFHNPTDGPFPSDLFTVADSSENTGLRVDLPKPDCLARPSDCEDVDVINTLDGFNLQPRLSIPFDGTIDVTTVNSRTIFLIKLGDTLSASSAGSKVVGINQIVWDPATNTLHVESDELLDQHTRYALVVTNELRDAEGRPVEASEGFQRFRHDLNFGQTHDRDLNAYRKALLDALQTAREAGVQESAIVAASVFTTQSATAVLEKIRDQIKAAVPAPADFNLGSGDTRTVFPLDTVTGITFNQQRSDNPLSFTPVTVRIDLLRFIPGAVGRIAFGKFLSADYRVSPGQYIPEVGTRTGTPLVQAMNEVYFNLYLPSGPEPTGGWPVAIFGHGSGPNKNTGPAANSHPLSVVSKMAERGIAVVMINMAGSGFGPHGTLTVNQTGLGPVSLPAGGRGIDQNGDHVIAEGEGRAAASPRRLLGSRDGLRQTAADLMQLVRVIEVGVDVEGDGQPDLDPSRVYYFGQSLGGHYGAQLLALEPSVRAGVINHSGGTLADLRLDRAFRSTVDGAVLATRTPSLISPPGVTHINGTPVVGSPRFDENIPLRDGVPYTVQLEDGTNREVRSPVINTVPGAMAIQELYDRREWVTLSGDSLAFAPHLRRDPLGGVPAKSVLYQYAKGDTQGPSLSRLLRAGDLADRATLFRTDLAVAEKPEFLVGAGRLGVPQDPHLLMGQIDHQAAAAVALGYQEQIATFFATDGSVIIHPEPARFFEVPIELPLPQGVYYVP